MGEPGEILARLGKNRSPLGRKEAVKPRKRHAGRGVGVVTRSRFVCSTRTRAIARSWQIYGPPALASWPAKCRRIVIVLACSPPLSVRPTNVHNFPRITVMFALMTRGRTMLANNGDTPFAGTLHHVRRFSTGLFPFFPSRPCDAGLALISAQPWRFNRNSRADTMRV